jgi:hypothetical protein
MDGQLRHGDEDPVSRVVAVPWSWCPICFSDVIVMQS